jgi:hypothetical protein
VNVRLALLPMWTPSGIFAFFGVSTKAGQDQTLGRGNQSPAVFTLARTWRYPL